MPGEHLLGGNRSCTSTGGTRSAGCTLGSAGACPAQYLGWLDDISLTEFDINLRPPCQRRGVLATIVSRGGVSIYLHPHEDFRIHLSILSPSSTSYTHGITGKYYTVVHMKEKPTPQSRRLPPQKKIRWLLDAVPLPSHTPAHTVSWRVRWRMPADDAYIRDLGI